MSISSISASAAPFPTQPAPAANPAPASPPAPTSPAAEPAPSAPPAAPTTTVAYNMDGSIVITMNAPKNAVSMQA